MSSLLLVPRHTFYALFFGFLGLGYLLFSVNITEIDSDRFEFVLLNIVLFVYVIWEIWRNARTDRWRVLVQPAVLASLVHFIGSYFLPNIRYMDDSTFPILHPRLLFSGTDAVEYLNVAMWAILLAVFAMWRGYRSRFAIRIASHTRAFLVSKGLIRTEIRVNFVAIFILGFISIGAMFLKVELGVFGYSSTAQSLESMASVTAWLKFASDGGTLVLLVLAMAVFTTRYKKSRGVLLLFIMILALQVIMGFLSGFKSQVVMPMVIVGISYYVIKDRMPYKWIAIAVMMLVLAYQVVEPLRSIINNSTNFNNQSIGSIISAVFDAATMEQEDATSSTAMKVFARQDMTTFTAQSFLFKDKFGVPDDAPDFFGSLIFSPVHAFVPRFIWSGKPTESTGYWYNVSVMGALPLNRTSVAMGPVSYAYFAGGYLGIFLVFWFIGFIQRITFETFTRVGLGGWLIYLGLFSSLVMIPSSLGAMFAGFFRAIPFVILAQYWVLHGKSRR